jgi:hypothetical protein
MVERLLYAPLRLVSSLPRSYREGRTHRSGLFVPSDEVDQGGYGRRGDEASTTGEGRPGIVTVESLSESL